MTLTTTTTTDGLAGDVRVGIYLRRSTDDEHQPYSIEAQDARFTDDASGATTARPGLHRALAAARAGVIDVLLVYRVDRLTRSLRDLVTLLDDLDQAGVVFRSATEPFDTATAMGRMLVQMLGMFAQFERDTIIDRVIAGMERKAAAGKWKGGRRPFGYQVDPPPARSSQMRARQPSSGSSSTPTSATGSEPMPSRICSTAAGTAPPPAGPGPLTRFSVS